ncbi:MAG: FAD-dependent oxidoreductase [Bacteroidota bacterium]|nr:FAD-dependent oxidoreductase [Bacteroidota bacterium]
MQKKYDIIIIGAGSAGLSVSLFMNKVGFNVLLIDKTDHHIGGDCLNDGCVPSKALIHIARISHSAKEAEKFGIQVNGQVDIKKATEYIYKRQSIIREHENAEHFRKEGLDVVLGVAKFIGRHEVEVEGKKYYGKKIVIATGSKPKKLKTPGIEKVKYYDNESIFHINDLPPRLLVVGGGPIGIELGQAFHRLGSKVTVVQRGEAILEHDEKAVTDILYHQLKKEGIEFIFNADVDSFPTPNEATITLKDGNTQTIAMDAVFVGIGRELNIKNLQLEKAGVEVKDDKIEVNEYMQTTNKNIYVCGDVAGSLQFSHAAEQQARIILNNLFSPLKKKLNNNYMSWVTFTDPELATFGLQEKDLKKKKIKYRCLDTDFDSDDRAITDSHRYGKLILYISQGSFLHKEKILGGTMVAPGAGELVQELILANAAKIPINAIFHKIYPYPVASRINQKAIVHYKQESLTEGIKKLLRFTYKLMN